MEKTHKCKICDWEGITHTHHIIPLGDYGEETDKNKIELCPNHHAEAYNNEDDFNKKHDLIGERWSEEKIKALERACFLFMGFVWNNNKPTNTGAIEYLKICKKYGFDKYDCIASFAGTTRRNIVNKYGGSDVKKEYGGYK